MDLHDFYYDLPEELIAQDPLSDRSSSRLMVLDKNTGAIEHKIFRLQLYLLWQYLFHLYMLRWMFI